MVDGWVDREVSMDLEDSAAAEAVARALGSELRRIREAHGWTRVEFVNRLRSRISDQTLWSYEHGQRNCTVVRLIELCRVLRVSAPEVLQTALQRSGIDVEALSLRVDLRAVVRDKSSEYKPILLWAKNRLASEPGSAGVVRLIPDSVRELAAVVGCSQSTLAGYLTRFTPTVSPAGPD